MTSSWRSTPLPKGWARIRRRILRRDNTCTINGPRCTTTSTEVDHIADATNHHPTNLRGVCTTCHATRTGRQAQAARDPRRPPEPHPGVIR